MIWHRERFKGLCAYVGEFADSESVQMDVPDESRVLNLFLMVFFGVAKGDEAASIIRKRSARGYSRGFYIVATKGFHHNSEKFA